MPVAVRISSAVWLVLSYPASGGSLPEPGSAANTPPQPGDRRDDPGEVPGRVDIGVNGTYWAGSIIGTLAALLETQYFAGPFQAPPWRAALAEPIPGRDR